MKIFKDCNFEKECPICKRKDKGDGVLIGIDGTQDGNNIEAELFHLKCIKLIYYKDKNKNIIAQLFGE